MAGAGRAAGLGPRDGQLRVLHVVTGLDLGGAEVQLAEVAARSRSRVTVVSLTGDGPVGGRLRAAGVEVAHVDLRRGPLQLLRLLAVARAARPHVVQTWLYHADLVGGLLARLVLRVPVAWGLHNSTLHREHRSRGTHAVLAVLARLAPHVPAAVVTCSTAAQELHVARGYPRSAFVAIPNGVAVTPPDASARARLRGQWGLLDEDVAVLRLARWDPQKDFPGLLRAVALLADRPHLHLVLCGRGCDADNAELLRLVGPLRDRVLLLGQREDVGDVVAACDVAVSSSRSEALPLAVLETMAAGLPQVVTDVGDCADAVHPVGAVVPPADAAALAAALAGVLDLPRQERLELGRRTARAARRHDVTATAAAYDALHERLARR